MQTARRAGQHGEVIQESAVVDAVVGDRVVVRSGSGRFEARRAASCAMVPHPGDEVLIAVRESGDVFVLAVFVRSETAEQERWAFEGDVELRSAGAFRIVGGSGVEVRSPTKVQMATRSLEVTAVEGTVGVERLTVLSGLVHASAQTVKTVLGTLDHVLERASMHVKRSYRYVEELDLTRADHIDQRAAGTFSVRGKNAFVAAEELVKVDGDQIHLG